MERDFQSLGSFAIFGCNKKLKQRNKESLGDH